MIRYRNFFLIFFILSLYLTPLSAQQSPLVSTESDPDAFIQDCVNVINGDYCETSTDLVITGPDSLILQRYYSTQDAVTGTQPGGWRIFPQRFLVIGKDFSAESCNLGKDRFDWTLAYIGERSGGILPYCGWRNTNGTTKDPLKIDHKVCGMVNTYAGEINGQTNHKNNLLHCKGSSCELVLGDGTRRIYQKVQTLPALILGEELTPLMAARVAEREYFLLSQEILPSGNQIFFSYDADGHLVEIEMKNKTSAKTISWIHLRYDFHDGGCQVLIETSDSRTLSYQLDLSHGMYTLTKVEGSHCIPVSYEYNPTLVKKLLPEGRFIDIEYQDGKVKSLKGPHSYSGNSDIVHSFSYGDDYTDVFDAMGIRTRYIYNNQLQLSFIEMYDEQNRLYRREQKFWGNKKSDFGFLLAKTIADGNGPTHSYRSFQYDKSGNVIEERLYGNLTGKQEAALQVTPEGTLLNPDEEECNVKTFEYSSDGFNLLTKMGDCKGNKTLYSYKAGTNLLIKKLIYEKSLIRKRTFQHYNEDAVCIKIVEDDGSRENESKDDIWSVNEQHIKKIQPKDTFPGVGLPEIIEEKALDLKKKEEILIKKLVNTYDNQSNLLSCSTYDANDQYAFTLKCTYNPLGQVTSRIGVDGKQELFTYDGIGNQISSSIPQENKTISTVYNFHNRPIDITEITHESQSTTKHTYDVLGRKIQSTDRYGNSTQYEYDAFHRLTKVIHPEVLDENNHLIRPTFNYTYDIFGNVLSIEDPKGFVINKVYNLRGDPTKIYYPDGSFELFKYDTEGSLHRSLTREKIITVYEYDYLGRCSHEELSTPNDKGEPSYLTSRYREYNGFRCKSDRKDDYVQKYSYDPAGRLLTVLDCKYQTNENDPKNRLKEFIYDSLGRVAQMKVWFGAGPQDYSLECFEYDLSGNVVEKRMEDAQGVVLLRRGFSYDSRGDCVEEYSYENGVKSVLIKTQYNAEREPISFVDGNGEETKVIIEHSYRNDEGQTVLKKTLVNPIGVRTEMVFDALSRVCDVAKKDSLGMLLSHQKILYDALGNKTCEIHDRIVKGKRIDSQKIGWIYGPMGRLEEEVQAADFAFERRTSYRYDSRGKMIIKSVSGLKNPINYSYHRDGYLHKIEVEDSKKELKILNQYSYDRRGNIESAKTHSGETVRRTYNDFNQVTKETITDNEGTYNLEYAYDRKGRLTEIILPDKSKIAYSYDALFGREVKRILSSGETLYSHSYDLYDQQGKLLQESYIGYLGQHEIAYDLNGRKIASKNGLFSESYSRDPLGRLTKVINNKTEEEYSYNSLSQLTEEKKSTVKRYDYDSLDNRIKANSEELSYNALNQLTAHSRAEFSYDTQGNLLRKVLDGEETHYENNALSNLISIEKSDKTTLAFSYDAFGRLLVEKHLDANKKTLSTSRYFYIGNQEIGSLSKTGKIETLKIPGLCGDQLSLTSVAFEIKSETYLPLHDIAGNVASLIDSQSRNVLESYQYTAFGEETIYNGNGEIEEFSPLANPWRFAEKRADQQSGLILFGLRFYDPKMGRWISQDPAGFSDGPNLYAYVHNNSLNYHDRFGLSTEPDCPSPSEGYMYGEVEKRCNCERHRTCKRGGDIGKTDGAALPRVTYDNDFEKVYKDFESDDLIIKDFYEDSYCYDLKGDGVQWLLDLPPDLGIGFINGIWNTFKDAQENALYVSRLSGGYNIHYVHNATHGTHVDLIEARMGSRNIATEPVRQLHRMWNSFFEKSSTDAKFLMICHSQGAIHVMNALLDYPPELRKRIFVVAIAPGGYIFSETCARVSHYRAEADRDGVARLDWKGALREKDTIVDLKSHPDAPWFDHPFMSLTYENKLREHIRKYIRSRGRLI